MTWLQPTSASMAPLISPVNAPASTSADRFSAPTATGVPANAVANCCKYTNGAHTSMSTCDVTASAANPATNSSTAVRLPCIFQLPAMSGVLLMVDLAFVSNDVLIGLPSGRACDLPDRIGNGAGAGANGLPVRTFDHDPQQRFGTGWPQQHAAFVTQ